MSLEYDRDALRVFIANSYSSVQSLGYQFDFSSEVFEEKLEAMEAEHITMDECESLIASFYLPSPEL